MINNMRYEVIVGFDQRSKAIARQLLTCWNIRASACPIADAPSSRHQAHDITVPVSLEIRNTVFKLGYRMYLPSRVCLPASRTRQTVRVFVVYHTACSLRSLDLIDADARSNSAGMMINLLDRAVTTSRACLTSSDSHVAIHPVYIL